MLNYLWSLGVVPRCLSIHDLCIVGLYPYDNCRNNGNLEYMFLNPSNTKQLQKSNEQVMPPHLVKAMEFCSLYYC